MKPTALSWSLWSAALLSGLAAGADAAPASAPPANAAGWTQNLTRPARGEQEVLLELPHFARYTLVARSPQGVALTLLDQVSGPVAESGEAGKTDGRLDLFLEKGRYKVLLKGHPKGAGEAALSVMENREMHPDPAPWLPERRVVSTTLEEGQQRSWWIEVKERRFVRIDVAGRSLGDLRMWRHGTQLTDELPAVAVITPRPGEPLTRMEWKGILEPGLHRLTAYGGKAQVWSRESADHPLHLRTGIPELPEAGRHRHVASPFGVDTWLLPKGVAFARLELPQSADAKLFFSEYYPERGESSTRMELAISKESREPAVGGSIDLGSKGQLLLEINRQAGEPYTLQHFNHQRTRRISTPGEYRLQAFSAGFAGDDLDLTGVLVRQPYDDKETL
ncbi:MAG: hypothetical protein HQL51_15945, partial [Magnetococcales bacterium]|nr:hypothetical protein [Magnetococcales bacterium]